MLRVEDLIGFKLQASCNDPERRLLDYEDIERLLAAHSTRLDWQRIEAYFSLFDKQQEFKRLRDKYRP